MKKIIHNLSLIALALVFGITSWGCSSKTSDFNFTNNSNIDRTDEPIVLSRDMIVDKMGGIGIIENQIPVPYYADGNAIPSQLDDIDMDGEWDELAFTLDIPANQTKEVSIRFMDIDELPEFESRTNVRFGVLVNQGVQPVSHLILTANELPVPLFERFQMDGPAWENDLVGFRQYIDGRNGRDLYGKTSPEMALDTVGISDEGTLEDNYHVMLPWGRDILAVGNSLGLGGLAIINNGEVVRLGVRMDAERNNVDITEYQLIKEGPVRSIFRLTYKGWDIGDEKITLTNDVIIWAGKYSHINKVKLSETETTDTLVVGLVNIHNDNAPVLLEETGTEYSAFYTHDKQTYDKGWFLGMGLIFPSEPYAGFMEAPDSGPGVTNSFLNYFELDENKSLEYHVIAGWELSDENFSNPDYFNEFITKEIQKISTPVLID
ncbi:MAG: DUF4861 domain-containing protein [Gracilimonas sp.]